MLVQLVLRMRDLARNVAGQAAYLTICFERQVLPQCDELPRPATLALLSLQSPGTFLADQP